jgi:hypothetical protein
MSLRNVLHNIPEPRGDQKKRENPFIHFVIEMENEYLDSGRGTEHAHTLARPVTYAW